MHRSLSRDLRLDLLMIHDTQVSGDNLVLKDAACGDVDAAPFVRDDDHRPAQHDAGAEPHVPLHSQVIKLQHIGNLLETPSEVRDALEFWAELDQWHPFVGSIGVHNQRSMVHPKEIALHG